MIRGSIGKLRSLFNFAAVCLRRRGIGLAVLGGLLFFAPASALAHDFSGWDALLKKYVAPKTIAGVRLQAVAYKDIKSDPEFSKVVVGLQDVSLSGLQTREQKLSFWVNVYNILAVKMIVDHYPIESIKDAGSLFKSVWKRRIGVVAGKQRTLEEVEHAILREMGEPRIHAAIVCASVSCPDLRPEAFAADKIDSQLDDQMKSFLANRGKGLRIDAGKKKLYLSRIFDWFEDDFESAGGVRRFLSRYVSEADRQALLNPKNRVTYMDYNWDVNEL